MRTCGLLGALLMLVALPGCPGFECGGAHTNAVGYSFTGCASGACDVAANEVAAGSSAHIDVRLDSGAVAIARVQSSNPGVATFVGHPPAADTLGIEVTALAPGTTELQLIDLHDGIAASVTVTVAAAASLDCTLGSPAPDGSVAVVVPSDATLAIAARDAAGGALIGDIPLVITGASNSVSVRSPGVYALSLLGADPAVVSGALPGGATFQLALRADHVGDLVSASAVAAAPVPDGADGALVDVTVTPADASGPVYGIGCVWSVADGDVAIEQQSMNALAQPAGEVTRFHLPADVADTTATCQIGALSTSIALHR